MTWGSARDFFTASERSEAPLSSAAEAKLARELSVIPTLLAQARGNLTGNARDLWITGTGTMQQQIVALDDLEKKTAGSGPAQTNEFDIKKAKDFQVQWTPRGWMREDLDLLGFEQQLYLRQPGYGTCYITGKYLLEDLLRERSKQLGDAFTMKRYFEEVNAAGLTPVSLIRWQLTGKDDQIKALTGTK
jgi:hypothetical protein